MKGLAEDLLEQATTLLNSDKNKPRQASLRRAVSTAYYALFHFLIDQAARRIVGVKKADEGIRAMVSRRFSHSSMNAACGQFAGSSKWGKVIAETFAGKLPKIPTKLADIASTFVALQEARHAADYNLMRRFTRAEVSLLIQRGRTAFKDWKAVSSFQEADLFLLWLLLCKEW